MADKIPFSSLEGVIGDAPIDGKQYARKDAGWEEVVAAGGGAGTFTPVADITALKAINTTDSGVWFDKWALIVEGEGKWYRLDRDSVAGESIPNIVAPTTGTGRWFRVYEDITTKADKVNGATIGNFAGLDANGNLLDSGINPADIPNLYDNIGELISENFASISDWSNVGSGVFTVVDGELNATIASPTTAITNYLYYNAKQNFNHEKYTITAKVKPGVAGATTYGIAFGFYSNGYNEAGRKSVFRIHFETGANFGKIDWNTGSVVSTSLTGLTESTDWHTVTIEKTSVNISCSIKNDVTGQSSVLIAKYEMSFPYTAANIEPCNARFAISILGGTHRVENLSLVCNDRKNSDYLIIGDSISAGLLVDDFTNRWVEVLGRRTGKSISIYARPSLALDDVVASDILAYNATNIIIQAGINNLVSDTEAATLTKLQSLISSLTGYTAGVNVFPTLLLPHVTLNTKVIAYNSLVNTSYAENIDFYSPIAGNFGVNGLYSFDGIHPNNLSSEIMASITLLKLRIQPSGKALADNDSLLYGTNRRVMVSNGKNRGRLSEFLMTLSPEAIEGALRIADTPTSVGGAMFMSTTPHNANIAAGCKFIGNSWIATSTTAIILDLSGASGGNVSLFYNAGLTVGNAFTPTYMALLTPTGLTIGSGTAAGGFVHLPASTTTRSHIRLTAGVAPSSPTNGDVWFDGTNLNIRIGGVTRTVNVT